MKRLYHFINKEKAAFLSLGCLYAELIVDNGFSRNKTKKRNERSILHNNMNYKTHNFYKNITPIKYK